MSRYIDRPISVSWPLCCSPEQLAGAADLQIVRGEHEAGAELLHRFDGLEALGGIAREGLARRGDQVGVGAVVRAADAAAQLVQLREPHVVGAVDHDGVGGGHVDAALDDGGAHQHVEAAVVEVDHQLLELALAHLPVADRARSASGTSACTSAAIFSMVRTSLCTK